MKNIHTEVSYSSGPDRERYRLIVLNCLHSGLHIQVIDCARGCQLFDWRGYVARHIVNSGEVGSLGIGRFGDYSCDKNFVCHLALVAAASHTIYSKLPTAHRHVAEAMVANSSEHLTAVDLTLLLAVTRTELRQNQVELCLDDLVSWKWIQRVTINQNNVFYDVDTRPHEHVFDPVTRRISDASRNATTH